MKRHLLPLVIVLAWSTGCAGAASNPSACPRPVEYSPEFQAQLAAELEALPPGVALERAMLDYGEVRARLRACR